MEHEIYNRLKQNNMADKEINGVVGDFNNPIQQNYSDTCAIKSQQLILNDFGIPVTEDQCVQYSIEHGWYANDGSGTNMNDIGKLLNDAGVPCSQTEGANVYDLVNELAQGHKIIVGVDSGELWDNSIWDWLKDIFFGDTPDHALIVAGIDMTDPNNPMVIITDPGNGHPAQPYPLDQFMDAWSDSNCFMVSTDVATPNATQSMVTNGLTEGHLNEIANVDYNTFTQFHNYSHQIDYATQGPRLYDMFQQFPTMDVSLDDALLKFNMPSYDSSSVLSQPTTNYIDPFSFDYSGIQNTDWISPMGNLQPVTDIFGNTRMVNPMDVDIMSGMPSSEFSHSWAYALQERNQAKLNDSSALEHERDLAVDKYHDAMNSGNYEEALKWEHIANSHQQEIYNLSDTPQYGLPAVAPGIDD